MAQVFWLIPDAAIEPLNWNISIARDAYLSLAIKEHKRQGHSFSL